jgi:hypothetical protein
MVNWTGIAVPIIIAVIGLLGPIIGVIYSQINKPAITLTTSISNEKAKANVYISNTGMSPTTNQ